jgi:hypothetical protein
LDEDVGNSFIFLVIAVVDVFDLVDEIDDSGGVSVEVHFVVDVFEDLLVRMGGKGSRCKGKGNRGVKKSRKNHFFSK